MKTKTIDVAVYADLLNDKIRMSKLVRLCSKNPDVRIRRTGANTYVIEIGETEHCAPGQGLEATLDSIPDPYEDGE